MLSLKAIHKRGCFVFCKHLRLTLLIVILSTNSAFAKDDLSAQEVLAMSKMTGVCGILNSMIYFQGTTDLPGGDEFIERFWNTEAARLGLSLKQFSDNCRQYIDTYNSLWKALETPQ